MQIRAIKGQSERPVDIQDLAKKLSTAIERAGFLTTVQVVNSSRIDVKGGHSGVSNVYATLNTEKRGYNYRVNGFTLHHCKLGYKRTNVLSWEQRVELNHLINRVLDKAKVSATIQSRGFKVRDKKAGAVKHWDVPYECSFGDSFQPGCLDWIFSSEAEAREAFEYEYKTERIRPEPFRERIAKALVSNQLPNVQFVLVRGGKE